MAKRVSLVSLGGFVVCSTVIVGAALPSDLSQTDDYTHVVPNTFLITKSSFKLPHQSKRSFVSSLFCQRF